MVHKWLLSDLINTLSTNHHPFLSTILVPSSQQQRMYLSGAQFHFLELGNGGRQIFDNNNNNNNTQSQWIEDMRNQMLNHLSTDQIHKQEDEWIQQIHDELAP